MGLIWALFSVGLASGAQLLLRSAMVELPPLTEIFTFLNHLLHLRAGTFGESDDGLPYLGTLSDSPDVFYVVALGGNGIPFGRIGAECAYAWLNGREHPLLGSFAFSR